MANEREASSMSHTHVSHRMITYVVFAALEDQSPQNVKCIHMVKLQIRLHINLLLACLVLNVEILNNKRYVIYS